MLKKSFNITNVILLLSILLFISISVNYFILYKEVSKNSCDNAKLINSLGQIRGSIQRYVKLKMNEDNKSLEVANYINKKLKEVNDIKNKINLTRNEKETFEKKYIKLKNNWKNIINASNSNLLSLSEKSWKISDDITTYAQIITQKNIEEIRKSIKYLTFMVLILLILIIISIYLYVKKGLEKEKITDPLTKLYNRRYFEEIIKFFANNYKRHKQPFSIAFIDIDNFKQINDKFGHQKGDEVLKKVSQIIIDNIRNTDFAFRYGGEEIVILFNNTTLNNACKKVNNIKDLISKKIILPNKKPITFSAGVKEYNGEDIYKFIQKADELVYKAKEKGKNIVICE